MFKTVTTTQDAVMKTVWSGVTSHLFSYIPKVKKRPKNVNNVENEQKNITAPDTNKHIDRSIKRWTEPILEP